MNVVIVGCGRVGALLAANLDAKAHNVTVIDPSAESFNRLPQEFSGRTVLGSGTDIDVQKRAGVEQADALIACTPGDNRNIAACQIAREMFQVPKVVARINDPLREKIFRDLGLQTVCPTLVGAELVREALLRGS
ncbi:MAG TPA: TrkA family potassium uptake protein [Chloroflexota bacterium]|nr:TrkA family potassium uptake protein [Chloroflexota bacterium]